jgi:hypothetical protein
MSLLFAMIWNVRCCKSITRFELVEMWFQFSNVYMALEFVKAVKILSSVKRMSNRKKNVCSKNS